MQWVTTFESLRHHSSSQSP